MNRYILLLLLTAYILSACSAKVDNNSFTVTGRIENVKDSCILVFFKSVYDGTGETIAVDTLIDGKFEFTAPAQEDVMYHIATPHVGLFPSFSVDFYAESGSKVKITGKDYLIKNWKVTSSARNNKIYQSYFKQVADIFSDMQLLELEYRHNGRSSEVLEASKPYQAKIEYIKFEWLKNQKEYSDPWLDIMLKASQAASYFKEAENLACLNEIWDSVDEDIRQSPKGVKISLALHPDGLPLKKGNLFPYDLIVSDIKGTEHSFKEFEGKAMLLYFGSYSCAPCIKAKKELDEIMQMSDRSFEVIGLNLDSEKKWRAKGNEAPVTWHDFNECKGHHGLTSRFGFKGVPSFVLVSDEGEILDYWSGYKEGIIRERINQTYKTDKLRTRQTKD